MLSHRLEAREASYVRRLGFSIFQLLELGCTRTYAKLASAVKKVRRIRRTSIVVLGRESLPQLELQWFRQWRKLWNSSYFLINDETVIAVTPPPLGLLVNWRRNSSFEDGEVRRKYGLNGIIKNFSSNFCPRRDTRRSRRYRSWLEGDTWGGTKVD